MRKPRNEQGLKEMCRDFGVPTKCPYGDPDAYTAGMFDTGKDRGPLHMLPRDVVNRVIPADTGMVSTSGLGISSAARADVTTGRLWKTPRTADRRVVPETQLPGSLNTSEVGLGFDIKKGGSLRKDMGKPVVEQ